MAFPCGIAQVVRHATPHRVGLNRFSLAAWVLFCNAALRALSGYVLRE
jgi:hypothetical protein